jgi:hypothetical protein
MAKGNKLAKYVNSYLQKELAELKISPIANAASTLTLEERTLIYKYSEDGYEDVNRLLRNSKGKDKTEFAVFLDSALKKLPDYFGPVYRTANLTDAELKIYEEAEKKNAILVEYSFISTSKSIVTANMFGKSCRFTIISRTGKEIEKFAKYGAHSGQNENEVLFRLNRKFEVLEVTKRNGITFIIMEEIVNA